MRFLGGGVGGRAAARCGRLLARMIDSFIYLLFTTYIYYPYIV